MTRLRKRNISLLIVLSVIITIFSTDIVNANTLNPQTLVLEKYLNAIQNKDALTAAGLCLDKRLNGDCEEISALNRIFSDVNLEVKLYKILYEKELISDEKSIFAVEIDYTNGKVEQTPILIQKINNEWLVIIDSEFADKNMYKLIHAGTEISSTISLDSLDASTRLIRWDYTFDINDTYKHYTSNFDVTASQVTLNYRQWSANGNLGLEYAIVKYGIFVDTVYATGTVRANNEDYANQMSLTCGSHSGVCLRIKINDTNSDSGRSFGEVYNQ
jgi:hypothetical protein